MEEKDEYAIAFAEFLQGRDLYLEQKTLLDLLEEFKKERNAK